MEKIDHAGQVAAESFVLQKLSKAKFFPDNIAAFDFEPFLRRRVAQIDRPAGFGFTEKHANLFKQLSDGGDPMTDGNFRIMPVAQNFLRIDRR